MFLLKLLASPHITSVYICSLSLNTQTHETAKPIQTYIMFLSKLLTSPQCLCVPLVLRYSYYCSCIIDISSIPIYLRDVKFINIYLSACYFKNMQVFVYTIIPLICISVGRRGPDPWVVRSNPGICLGRLSLRIVHVPTTGWPS
jgi:hypothetical protein